MELASKIPLLVITGPTASGKTALAVELAKAFDGEVVSADSMQLYEGMDIATAKPTLEEMQGIPHHLIGILKPQQPFSVADYAGIANQTIREIVSRQKLPILAGGTGLYIQAVVDGIRFSEEDKEDGLRRELERRAKEEGAEVLLRELAQVDPEYAEKLHPNNKIRVIRALEFHRLTGRRISEHNEEQKGKESPYNFAYFVLNDERQRLYERIDARVDEMLEEGLLQEVEGLKAEGLCRGMVSMQGLGYKELLSYLDGECSLEEAVRILKRDTRHFAKRQLTWFRRERDVIWLDRQRFGDDGAILEEMLKILREKGMIEDGA